MSVNPEIKTINISDIVFDEIVYPRKDHDPILVQKYAEVLDEIEASQKFISVSSDMKLLDGKHRWLAYRKRNKDHDQKIQVLVYNVTTPHEQLKLSAKLNSEHGWQLTNGDKESVAKSLYAYGATYDDIALSLSVGKKKISGWLSRTVKEEKAKRKDRIFDLWMQCYTHKEIADVVNLTEEAVRQQISQIEFSETKLGKSFFSDATYATEFSPPIYNIWKQQKKSTGSKHFGNSEQQWLENLLYLYTEPFDIIVDPFAGGGSTIDVCKKRGRRYYVSDRKPIVEREHEIREHELTTGLPSVPRWKDVKLVYLDPPYWKQSEGQYSEDAEDLANMPLEQFNATLLNIITEFGNKLSGYEDTKYIALIIQPTQWKAPGKHFTDHVCDMLRAVSFPVNMRYSVPYESQQCTAQMVEWAKQNKQTLVLTREIVVWEVQ